MHRPLWWIARVTQGHLVCISMHQVSDSYFITRRHISGRFLISFFFFFPFSKAPWRPLAFATCIRSKFALFLNAIVSGSHSKCCWINKINNSILPAVLSGFLFNTKFLMLLLNSFYKRGLEDLWHRLCIWKWKVLFLVIFHFFLLLPRSTLFLIWNNLRSYKKLFSEKNLVLNYLVICWELLAAQTHHEVPWPAPHSDAI